MSGVTDPHYVLSSKNEVALIPCNSMDLNNDVSLHCSYHYFLITLLSRKIVDAFLSINSKYFSKWKIHYGTHQISQVSTEGLKHISLKPSPFLIYLLESIIFNYFWILEQKKLKFRRRISCNTLFHTESLFAVKRKGNLLSVNHLTTPQHFPTRHLFSSKLPVWLNLCKTKQRCLSTKLFALQVLAQRFLQH